jgi:hypothetical protein
MTNACEIHRRCRAVVVGCFLGILFLAGCGGDSGLKRYDLNGAVTYDGTPITVGMIMFEPDTKQGNSGPGTLVQIKNGSYETARGKGVVGGPHILVVRVDSASSNNMLAVDSAPVEEIPADMRIEMDLPKQSGEFDIDIPPQLNKK